MAPMLAAVCDGNPALFIRLPPGTPFAAADGTGEHEYGHQLARHFQTVSRADGACKSYQELTELGKALVKFFGVLWAW
jgi:hypothetical protein